ncbi:LysE family translocator [Ruegeria sp. 2205SS24-7]|uniref:LysE family translocator n=1 Tax=Ruegeria discodermiae TaxID=3064389 RepID=UPI0027425C72|nr:LysE family translocator [Ruegeria sp. 2205SS24-7]MDP5216381.1 LysE family translocator [Ruegeria sp. 2205SS24-7]
MGWEHLVAFNLTLLAAILSPGPAMLYFVRQTLSQGRRTGIYAVLGLGSMAVCWTITALLGLDAVFRLFPWAYAIFKAAGALYLIYLACKTWRAARDPLGEMQVAPARAFLGGVLVNLANPKSILFAAALLVVIFPPGLTLADKAVIVLNHLMVEWLVGGVLVLLLSTGRARQGYLRAKPMLDRIAAGIMGLLGLRLLLSR